MIKILLVEDEKVLAQMYKERLEKEGFKVFLALGAKEALDILKKEALTLILLDILLPKENGVSLLRKIRELKLAEGVPILAFSNYDDPVSKKEALGLGVKEYLLKTDYTPSQLISRIKSCLNLK